jgi:hypothetical protein
MRRTPAVTRRRARGAPAGSDTDGLGSLPDAPGDSAAYTLAAVRAVLQYFDAGVDADYSAARNSAGSEFAACPDAHAAIP